MSERGEGHDQACAHLRVQYVTQFESSGLTRGWWECTLCGSEFVARTRLAAAEEQIATLKEQVSRWKMEAYDHGY